MSGTVAEYLFEHHLVTPIWLVGTRLFVAGLLLLCWSRVTTGESIFKIWHNKREILTLIAFALLGILPSQLTYLMAIRYSNAPTATVLQFLGPIFIMGYVTVFNHKLPNLAEIVSVILALAGTFLLVTNGHIDSLALSIAAIAWGIGAGVSQASYTLIPAKLLSAFDDKLIVGWGMLLGSLPISGFVLSTSAPKVSMITIISIIFIIVFGTMLAYLLCLMSTKYISPSVSGMLSAFEPLTATVLSVAFLGTHLAPVQLLGGLFIVATVFVQTIFNRND